MIGGHASSPRDTARATTSSSCPTRTAVDLTPDLVAALCDRRRGIGGDGVLRVVRAATLRTAPRGRRRRWFMDYWNADGSLAEMCGNGVRVFARYLIDAGLAAPAGGAADRHPGRRRAVR